MDSTVKRTVKETVEAYELKLPEIFTLQPAYTIELPKGYKALVFLTSIKERADSGTGYTSTNAWRTVIVRKDGRRASDRNRGYLHPDRTDTDPLNANFFIQDWAAALSAKKTVETVDED